MSSSSKKIIVVVGATGNQGSSVAHTFLNLSNWHVRCVTRDTSSKSALAFAKLGAEVVQADLSSLPSITKAFENANAIFVNTTFWGIFRASAEAGNPDAQVALAQEIAFGKNAAIAAAALPSLERFVYSALPGFKDISKGKYATAHHFEGKAAIVDFIEKEQLQLAKKTSYIYIGCYATSPFFLPHLDEASGKYQFLLPLPSTMRFPIIDEKKSPGPLVRALVEDEDAGVKLLAYDSFSTLGEIVEMWGRAKGKEVVLLEVSAQFAGEKLGLSKQVLDAVLGCAEFGYTGGVEGVIGPPELKGKWWREKTFEKWLGENKDAEIKWG